MGFNLPMVNECFAHCRLFLLTSYLFHVLLLWFVFVLAPYVLLLRLIFSSHTSMPGPRVLSSCFFKNFCGLPALVVVPSFSHSLAPTHSSHASDFSCIACHASPAFIILFPLRVLLFLIALFFCLLSRRLYNRLP